MAKEENVLKLIKKRRSVRDYSDKKVPGNLLEELIEGAIWAPTGSNIQPWYFGLVDNENVLDRIINFSPGLLGNPPAIIILCSDKKRAQEKGGELGRDLLCIMDISMAAQNIMLLATEKGLSTCCVKSFNQRAVNKLLGLPEHVKSELIISVGYATKEPARPSRRSKEEVTFLNNWSEANG